MVDAITNQLDFNEDSTSFPPNQASAYTWQYSKSFFAKTHVRNHAELIKLAFHRPWRCTGGPTKLRAPLRLHADHLSPSSPTYGF